MLASLMIQPDTALTAPHFSKNKPTYFTSPKRGIFLFKSPCPWAVKEKIFDVVKTPRRTVKDGAWEGRICAERRRGSSRIPVCVADCPTPYSTYAPRGDKKKSKGKGPLFIDSKSASVFFFTREFNTAPPLLGISSRR